MTLIMKPCIRMVAVMFVVVGLSGCADGDESSGAGTEASRCRAWCEREKAVDCTDPSPPSNCATRCADLAAQVIAMDCSEYLSAALACAEANDACTSIDECIPENDRLLWCVEGCLLPDAGCLN